MSKNPSINLAPSTTPNYSLLHSTKDKIIKQLSVEDLPETKKIHHPKSRSMISLALDAFRIVRELVTNSKYYPKS